MTGVNIPTHYGGIAKEAWHKNQKNCVLPPELAE